MERLAKDLSEAFAIDAKYKAEDDMKKRAIVTARSYDEFKNLVAAAQLKPIDAGDIARKSATHANRSLLSSGSCVARDAPLGFDLRGGRAAEGLAASRPLLSATPTGPPANGAEFDRAWRRLPKERPDRAAFLAALGEPSLARIFTLDVDGELLGDVLAVLAEAAASGEGGATAVSPAVAARLVLALTRSQGFPLARDLLSKRDLAAAAALRDAAAAAGSGDDATALSAQFELS
jgi:hypothetical protein